MRSKRWDAVVVGAGPAGSTAARALALRGLAVLLVDRRCFPRAKVCGGCVGAAAIDVLESSGLASEVVRRGAVVLHELRIGAPPEPTGGARRGGPPTATIPLPRAVAISRESFDLLLVEAAIEAGVAFMDGSGAAMGSVEGGDVELRVGASMGSTHQVRAGVVIDATGLGVGLRGLAHGQVADGGHGAGARVAAGSRIGVGAVLGDDGAPRSGAIEMMVGRKGYVGVVRLEDGRLGVAAAVDANALRGSGPGDVVAEIVRVHEPRLAEACRAATWTGTPALTRRPADVAGPRFFRVGDAAGYVEPFTGEGIGWAMASGRAVAPFATAAVEGRGDGPAHGWRRWCEGLRRRQRLCRILAAGLRRPGLVRPVVRALGRLPRMAAPLVNAAAAPLP